VDKVLGVVRSDGKATTVAWYTGVVRHNQLNQGRVCVYCYAVYGCRYKHKGYDMSKVVASIGISQESNQSFLGLREGVIAFCIENGGRGGRIAWGIVEAKSLVFQQVSSLSYEDPVDEHWGFEEYKAEKGDPTTNGLGHRRETIFGRDVVIVPGRRIWKVRRKQEFQNIVKQLIDDGRANIMDNQIERRAEEMEKVLSRFVPHDAVGATGHDSFSSLSLSLSSLLRASTHGSSSSSSSGPPPAQVAPHDPTLSEGGTPSFGFGIFASGGAVGLQQPSLGAPGLQKQSPPQGASNAVAAAPAAPAQPAGLAGRKKTRGCTKATSATLAPAAKAPPVSSPAESSPALAGRGRPKRDLKIAADEVCDEFASLVEGHPQFSNWFGNEHKTNRRSIKKLVDDLKKHIDSTKDLEEYSILSKQRKRAEVVLAILDFCNRNGVAHVGLVDLIDTQRHFLRMDPPATLVFPQYVTSSYYLLQVRACTEAADFWARICEAGLHFPLEAVSKRQSVAIGERVVALTKAADMQVQLDRFFPEKCDDLKLSKGDVRKQVMEVSLIVWCDRAATSELEDLSTELPKALESTKDPTKDIMHSLTVFPAGRELIASAAGFVAKVDVTLRWAREVCNMLDEIELTSALADEDTPIDLTAVDTKLLEAERASILKQHFNDLLQSKVAGVTGSAIKHCFACFKKHIAPLLTADTTAESWATGAGLITEVFNGLLDCKCIASDPWFGAEEQVVAVRTLRRIVDSTSAVFKPKSSEDMLEKECLALYKLGFEGSRSMAVRASVALLVGHWRRPLCFYSRWLPIRTLHIIVVQFGLSLALICVVGLPRAAPRLSDRIAYRRRFWP